MEIVYNSVTIKYKAGKKLTTFEEIMSDYLHSSLIVDVMNLLVIIIDI
jgi:hypothetical protein